MGARNRTGFVCLPLVLVVYPGIHGLLTLGLLDVDSRSGALYCQMCDDIVWDPTFEEMRLKKIGTGTFSSQLPPLPLNPWLALISVLTSPLPPYRPKAQT